MHQFKIGCVAIIKCDVPPGARYISRIRSTAKAPIQDVFEKVNRRFAELEEKDPEKLNDPLYLKENVAQSAMQMYGVV